MSTLLAAGLMLVFSFEGLGIFLGRELSYFLIIFLAVFLFVHTIFQKKKIIFPKWSSIFFTCFVVSSSISSLLSQNVSQTFSYSIYQIALLLFFICAYNYREVLEKRLYYLIFGLSILFSLYFLLLQSHIFKLTIPTTGYQFVFSHIGSHVHLGDFLILPTMILLYHVYCNNHKKILLVGLLLLSPFILFSFSRSAYLSIAMAGSLLHVFWILKKGISKNIKLMRLLVLLVVVGSFFAFLVSTSQSKNKSTLSILNTYLVQNKLLSNNKDLMGRRPQYFTQALHSFKAHPFFGIGPSNFHSVSKNYAQKPYLESTEIVHNIFLEVLVGQGLVGFTPFMGLIILFVWKSKKNALYFILLGMLINFQTDYTYQIYTFLLLFFVIAGTIHEEKNYFSISGLRQKLLL